MAHKKSFEDRDRSLQDLRGNIRPFGNALMIQTDMPFQCRRLSFPIPLTFAIIINKDQGQFL